MESLGKIWLLTIGKKLELAPHGSRVTQVGPFSIEKGWSYTAQYMEATLQPGIVSKPHLYSGVEAFYIESGDTCLETPEERGWEKEGRTLSFQMACPWS